MRTRVQAWTIRGAVVAVLAAAGVVGLAAPAFAAPVPEIEHLTVSPGGVNAGGSVTLNYEVHVVDNGNDVGGTGVDVSVVINDEHQTNSSEVSCVSGCSISGATIKPGGNSYTAQLTAAGYVQQDVLVDIGVKVGNASNVTAACGPPDCVTIQVSATPTVPEIDGVVTDLATAQPIAGAKVSVADSLGQKWDGLVTDDGGAFTVSGSTQPIAAGPIQITVTMAGYADKHATFTGVRNQPLSALIKLTGNLSTATPTSQPTPTGQQTITNNIDTGGNVQNTDIATPGSSGVSGFSLVLIIVGGLLVLLGVAAVVLLFVRRNNGDGDPRRGPGGPGRGGPPPGQRGAGQPVPTHAGYGAGGPRPQAPGSHDQTVISRSPVADAPTQHGPRPGQQGPSGGYGQAPGGGYGQ
jgi:hypothetical protein